MYPADLLTGHELVRGRPVPGAAPGDKPSSPHRRFMGNAPLQSGAGLGAVFEYRFDPAEALFAGHFPGRPVLPGVFQLEMTRLAAEELLGCALAIGEVGKAKFLRIISPGELVRLELKISDAEGVIRARGQFSVGGQPAGETVLHLSRRT